MIQRFVPGVIFLVLVLAVVACEGAGEESPLVSVSVDDFLEPLRDRPRREQTVFFGDSGWTVDYYGRLYVTDNGGYDWNRVTLPDDGSVELMQVEDGGRLVAVVTNEGILMRTADAGATWSSTDLMEQVKEVANTDFYAYFDHLEFDSSLENGIWIDFCQILRTSDGGNTWTTLADDLKDKGSEERCVANAVQGAESGAWFAEVEIVGRMLTSGNYLFRSFDDGETWQEICSLDEVGMLLKSVQSCFNLDSDDEGLNAAVVALTEDLWDDDNETLELFADQIEQGVFVAHSLVIPNEIRGAYEQVGLVEDTTTGRIWSDNDEQLAYTDDGGKQWHVVSSPMPEPAYVDFSLGPDRGFAIYQYQYLAVSEDIGKSWQSINPEPRDIYDFAVLPDAKRVIVATDRGLSVIDAETLDWRDLTGVGAVSVLEVAGRVVWAFADDGVHRSVDAGDSWTRLEIDVEEHDLYFESTSCSADQCLVDGYQTIARLTADPAGIEVMDLTEQLGLEENYLVRMVLDADLDRGWAAMEDGRVYASDDGGRTWQKAASLRQEISEFSSSPGNTGFLAWGESNKYLWSADGISFESRRLPVDRDTSIFSVCWVNDSIALLYAYNWDDEEDFFFASTDAGGSWGPVGPTHHEDTCRVRGGLVMLNTMIARVK